MEALAALERASTVTRIAAYFIPLGLFDVLVCRHTRTRWLLLHSFANAIVSTYAWNDLWRALDFPQQSCVGRPSSEVPPELIVAMHVYHLLFFKCSAADLFHHLFFVTVLGFACLYFDAGPCAAPHLNRIGRPRTSPPGASSRASRHAPGSSTWSRSLSADCPAEWTCSYSRW